MDRTRIRARYLDRERTRQFGAIAELKLYQKKSGQQPNDEKLTISDGWLATKERNRGEVGSLFVIEVIERAEITLELIRQIDRVTVNGLLCTLETWDAPDSEPRVWMFYAREIKHGGVKR